MKRWSIGAASLLAITLVAIWLGLGRGHKDAMVRVGGGSNACACTHRIEP